MNGFTPNLIFALILIRSGFGAIMGEFRLFLTDLYARNVIVEEYYRFMFLLKKATLISALKDNYRFLQVLHYENMPIQIYRKFHPQNPKIFK